MTKRILILGCLSLVLTCHAEKVIYTINSRSTVRSDGQEPIGSIAVFKTNSTSGKVGQLTEGKSCMLTLYGYGNQRIHSISVSAHSNSMAGAGALWSAINDDVIWEIPQSSFASVLWNSEYTTDFVPITKNFSPAEFVGQGDSVRITVTAYQNSLYIESYTIEYSDASAVGSVKLLTDNATEPVVVKESKPSEGVVLPEPQVCPEGWYFIGWTTNTYATSSIMPTVLYKAGEVIYPIGQMVLYALFADKQQETDDWTQATTLTTGNYLISCPKLSLLVLDGTNQDKYVLPVKENQPLYLKDELYCLPSTLEYPEDAVWYVEFLENDSIRVKNKVSNNFVGSSSSASSSVFTKTVTTPWQLLQDTVNQWTIYRRYAPDTICWAYDMSGNEPIIRPRKIMHKYWQRFVFFNLDDKPETEDVQYQTFADKTESELATTNSLSDVFFKDGYVINPKRIPLKIFNTTGQVVVFSCTDICLFPLPRGAYILQLPNSENIRFFR
ncbi:MAG: hypothetical protein IJ756_03340 [Paludibacteraceae bacterium]|nr:hypothetical protein [Paludibacteraceae bacterium]